MLPSKIAHRGMHFKKFITFHHLQSIIDPYQHIQSFIGSFVRYIGGAGHHPWRHLSLLDYTCFEVGQDSQHELFCPDITRYKRTGKL